MTLISFFFLNLIYTFRRNFNYHADTPGTYKVRNEIDTKRNETKSTKTKTNETKSTKTKRNETKSTKWKRNETKPTK